jgi:predicted O-linked N-acetylglucosamine transferase (SPINDLY family)
MRLHRSGQLAEAERLYREALSQDPGNANASFLLGGIALQAGRVDDAARLFRAAIQVDPQNAVFHANLGECYRRLKRPSDAMDEFLHALTLRPDLAEPLFNLGLLMRDHGELDLAISCFECAAELKPGVHAIQQRLAEASEARKARRPGARGQGPVRNGMSAQLLAGVAASLGASGRHDAAVALCRTALELDPACVNAHHNLGAEMLDRSRMDEAIAAFEEALRVDPRHVAARCNLGNAFFKSGRTKEAIASFQHALELGENPGVHSNILFAMPFDPDCEQEAILEEARRWNRQYGEPFTAAVTRHDNDPTPNRRLRIGYVSPDFRVHCQSLFTVPLLSRHDRERFEIVCYSDVAQPDKLTERLRGSADVWRSILGKSDSDVAAQLREDRIDVLVDLTMHMEKNRLRVFARKPAPVQISWLAYPGTTGLSAIDYRITDPYLDPIDSDVSVYSECTIWLPDAFWCYDPLTSGEPPVGPLPARSNGCITFACLNNFAKVNEPVLELWAAVLREVTGSRIVILAPEGEPRRRVRARLAAHGINAERIEFVDRRPRSEYLASYGAIDICLDTFPSNGHTTSLDALWMGVPVVTLAGKTVVGKAGVCQAMNLGLGDELIASSPGDYVRIATRLCANLDHLGDLRAGLRARMEASPLMDAGRFARNIETAYRQVWSRWCQKQLPTHQFVSTSV